MLRLKNISKIYYNAKDPAKSVNALQDISIDFPRKGFISILGPSGCGKTTLLNILGGLDTNYKGKMVVDDVDTISFKQEDWDAYRNNHVGFVFQEYNLIPHQNISKNVELVLTIAGASKIEIKETSKKFLTSVGLQDKLLVVPNNLSGGQKQRVAIARALVNNPEVILADEPTSALDTNTSAQIMDILKEISKNKLVIMVTHNVDLARKYSSRIINILDGKIESDEKLEDLEEDEESLKYIPQSYKYSKSKMDFKTAAALSLDNLKGKKRRTILTTLAGSIGIICLSIILGIMNGATRFAKDLNNEILKIMPFVISQYKDTEYGSEMVTSEDLQKIENMSKEEQSKNKNKIQNPENVQKKFDELLRLKDKGRNVLGSKYQQYVISLLNKYPDAIDAISISRNKAAEFAYKKGDRYKKFDDSCFTELPYSNDLSSQYEFLCGSGRWPEKKEEVVVVLNEYNQMEPQLFEALGMVGKNNIDPAELCGKECGVFVPFDCIYKREEGSRFYSKVTDYSKFVENSSAVVRLKIVGVVRAKTIKKEGGKFEEQTSKIFKKVYPIRCGICYSKALGDYIFETIKNSDIVKDQKATPEKLLGSKQNFLESGSNDSRYREDKYLPDKEKIKKNLNLLGYSESAHHISIYMRDPVKHKDDIVAYLNKYNEGKSEQEKVKFIDESQGERFTRIIRKIGMFLILTIGLAALITSLIMVGILEFVSVLERTREIGILRSIGARKKDISNLFKSEALIIGLFTGVAGVVIGLIFSIPLNMLIKTCYGIKSISLICIDFKIFIGLTLFSLFVTLLAGLIPAKIASRKDPVKILTGSNN